MENIERTQFVVLTGHLDDQPLPDLLQRLRVQRKSGRLQVEYADAPGSFFFEDGQLVDARLGTLRGVEALYAALALDGASFNFNPLVKPPERNIDRQGQQFIRDLIEAPRREGLAAIEVAGRELDAPTPVAALRPHAPLQLPPAAELVAPLEQRLTAVEAAINTNAQRFSRERLIFGSLIGFLAGLSLITTLHVFFNPFGSAPAPPANVPASNSQTRNPPATTNPPATNTTAGDAQTTAGTAAGGEPLRPTATVSVSAEDARKAGGGLTPAPRREYVVPVLVQVRDGRVTSARLWKSQPGARAYEAVALRVARERRYPENFTGGERVNITIKP